MKRFCIRLFTCWNQGQIDFVIIMPVIATLDAKSSISWRKITERPCKSIDADKAAAANVSIARGAIAFIVTNRLERKHSSRAASDHRRHRPLSVHVGWWLDFDWTACYFDICRDFHTPSNYSLRWYFSSFSLISLILFLMSFRGEATHIIAVTVKHNCRGGFFGHFMPTAIFEPYHIIYHFHWNQYL